jgi:membrane protein DedA with SNARE-associated domain
MNAESIGALVRTVLQLVAGFAIAKGIGDQELWLTITAATVSIVSGAWSFWWIRKKTA